MFSDYLEFDKTALPENYPDFPREFKPTATEEIRDLLKRCGVDKNAVSL